jgi:hypothetical protein
MRNFINPLRRIYEVLYFKIEHFCSIRVGIMLKLGYLKRNLAGGLAKVV